MALKQNSPHGLDRVAEEYQREYEKKTVTWLARKGEEWVRECRDRGPYKDRTANLRNSIGYIVVQHGRVVTSSFPADAPSGPGGNAPEAGAQGKRRAEVLSSGLDAGKTYLILVAGMSYAIYVERHDHLWVIGQVKAEVEGSSETLKVEFKDFLEYGR